MFGLQGKFIKTPKNKRKLLGTDTQGTINLNTGYVLFQRFIADASGSCTEIESYCLVSSNAIAGIYSDSAGDVGNLLNQTSSTALTSGSWGKLVLPSTSIVSGTAYWLAVTCAATGGASHTNPTNTNQYKYLLRSFQALPSNGAGSTYYSNYLVAIRANG